MSAKSWKKSRFILLGHIQNILGLVVVALPFVTPANFPGLPQWVYGLALMACGVITYWLRAKTTQPLG